MRPILHPLWQGCTGIPFWSIWSSKAEDSSLPHHYYSLIMPSQRVRRFRSSTNQSTHRFYTGSSADCNAWLTHLFRRQPHQVKEFLGEGGKKKVYSARDSVLDRVAASRCIGN